MYSESLSLAAQLCLSALSERSAEDDTRGQRRWLSSGAKPFLSSLRARASFTPWLKR